MTKALGMHRDPRPRVRLIRRVTLAITAEEDRAIHWMAQRFKRYDARGRLITSTVLRDYSLRVIVRLYRARGAA